ncbi:MAG: DUF1192 domain-containing protein [Pseudomonadota bacterium]
MFDDDQPKITLTGHEVGMDLAALSIEELDERIALLEGEIARLREEITRKSASRAAADSVFKS